MLRKFIMFVLIAGTLLGSTLALATEESSDFGPANGGDICENRIQNISADIEDWIYKGGPEGLIFSEGTNVRGYNYQMLQSINEAYVSCVDEKLIIGQAEKTCKNYVDAEGKKRLKCNAVRFLNNSEEEQYKLIHHEYAGLAGLEVNNGTEASNYYFSNQIAAFLEEVTVKKLAIKRPTDSIQICDLLYSPRLLTDENVLEVKAKGYNLISDKEDRRENSRLLRIGSERIPSMRRGRSQISNLGVFEDVIWNGSEVVTTAITNQYYFRYSEMYWDDYTPGEYREHMESISNTKTLMLNKVLNDLPSCQDLRQGTIKRNLVKINGNF